MIYIFMTVLAVCFAGLTQYVQSRNIRPHTLKKPLLFFLVFTTFFIICFPAAVRVDVGTDYWSYVLLYNNPEIFAYAGPGFSAFIEILNNISSDPRLFFVISSIIIYGNITWSFFKNSRNFAFSLLLFIIMEDYFVSMNVIRQYMAVALLAPAYIALERDKKIFFFLIVIIASVVFHSSSIISLGLIFFVIKKRNRFQWILSSTILFAATIIFIPTVKYMIITYTEYGRYFSNSYADEIFSVATPLLMIYIVLFIVTVAACSGEFLLNSVRARIFLGAVVFNTCVLILSFFLTQNTYRLSYIFNIAIAMYFPDILDDISKRSYILQLMIKYSAIVLFSIWTILLLLHNNQNALPYHSIFD